MCDYDSSKILLRLQEAMEAAPTPVVEPMQVDRWLATSVLQKAVRRGDSTYALRAASALWHIDRQKLYQRLAVIACEDVGAGNPVLVTDVLTAVSSSVWRRRVGCLRVALFLTRQLCKSVKSRIADDLYIQAERAPEYAPLRARLAMADDETLAGIVADVDAGLVKRGLALWLLAGTRKFPSDVIPSRHGVVTDAIESLRMLSAPVALVESCIAVVGRLSHPLSLFMPLIWQEVQKHQAELSVQHNAIPAPIEVEDVPLYSCDMFTRVGGASFRRLQKAVPELQRFSTRQVGLANFYREGALLDKALTSPYLDTFRQAGEMADIEGNGMDIPSYLGLRDSLDHHATLLDGIRTEQLQQHLDGVAA
jgi:hypothetical protein